jgi:hypothetical protein
MIIATKLVALSIATVFDNLTDLTIPDFLGFHNIANLKVNPLLDIDISSMSLTTCLALCSSLTSQVAIIAEGRCICSQGVNVYIAAFTQADSKSAKKTNSLTVFFVLLGSAHLKAVHKLLVKSTQDVNFTRKH